jgi:Big-like domain-containing protein
MLKRGVHTRWSGLFVGSLLLAVPALAIELDPVEPWVTEIDLRDLPAPPAWKPGDPIKVIPRRIYPKPPKAGLTLPPQPALPTDPLAGPQPQAALSGGFGTPIHTFDGQGFSGVFPADPVGEAGPRYYVQMINGNTGTRTAFYDKGSGGLVVSFLLQDLAPPGSACRSGLGDPIALYDHLADRWFLSEFANDPPNALCLYVARTDDPISGGWFHYQINTATFPDYPKYAVWPDAYYVNTNESSLSVYALDRENMLQGLPLRPTQKFTAPDLSFWLFQTLPPVDLDGAPPPAGSPAYFVRQRDTELHNPTVLNPTQDFVELWPFRVDWTNPANSRFGPAINVPTSEFNSLLCDPVTFSCIPQPGGRPLDPLREAVMWKPQYRNFGTHESIVGNFPVVLDAPNHAGVRWFELRRVGVGPWTLHQEGTWAGPLGQVDPTSRWMAGSGMDREGNIAVAYDVSSAVVFPGIRYTGRLAGDPLGTMTQGDVTLVEGTGPSVPFERWGDYNSLNVDTENDCVFWFTSMYGKLAAAADAGDWATRIGAFKFDNCVVQPVNNPPIARNDEAATTPNTAITIDVLADNGHGADSDPDGDSLTVTAVADPPNGTTEHLGEGRVSYAPDPGFRGTDTFTYELSDGRGGTAVGTVTIAVRCPATPEQSFADDFEPAPEPGWTVATAANANPLSVTWTAGPDPFAHSPQTSFFSDATTLDLKDDRLTSPPVALGATSRLIFWHRFEFEDGFDGGVLEVSTDGGATWVDVQIGGGAFVQGGYNGTIAPNFGSPIAGRAAWTGSSGDPDVMTRVEVDLGAFASPAVLLRWRLTADPLAPGSLPGLAWWIDDVTFVDMIEDCPSPPLAQDDHAVTQRDTAVTIAVLANDSDPDGDPLTVTAVADPAHGGAVSNTDGTVTYTPDPGFVGSDSFEYTISDGAGGTDSATVFVTVEDQPTQASKVTGNGRIAAGGGEASFHVNAQAGKSPPGKISYDAGDAGGPELKGTVTELELLSDAAASLRGSCELGSGSACSFEVTVEDNGEPGAGVDRFSIRVFDGAGNLVHAAGGVLGKGNIEIQ